MTERAPLPDGPLLNVPKRCLTDVCRCDYRGTGAQLQRNVRIHEDTFASVKYTAAVILSVTPKPSFLLQPDLKTNPRERQMFAFEGATGQLISLKYIQIGPLLLDGSH